MSAPRVTPWLCPPKTIVVGVDFGEASACALAVAGVVATGFHAELRALHAERFEPPPYFTLDQIARLESERHVAQTAATAHLSAFASGSARHAVASIVVDAGPVDALLDAAATADLMVLGTHGRRGPGRWWLGSVAERVVRAAPIPVLVTRAAATPPRAVFERLALVEDATTADADARVYAERLASLAGGSITTAGRGTACETDVLQQASLVVMTTPPERSSWGLADMVAQVLGGCDRPVLFIPAR